MKVNLSQSVMDSISDFARQCNLDKVILFGSRARDTYRERSDIDLAIQGGDTVTFAASVDEDIPTSSIF